MIVAEQQRRMRSLSGKKPDLTLKELWSCAENADTGNSGL